MIRKQSEHSSVSRYENYGNDLCGRIVTGKGHASCGKIPFKFGVMNNDLRGVQNIGQKLDHPLVRFGAG